MRFIKVLLSLCIALMCIVYATQNVVNLDAAHYVVSYVMSGVDHEAYPDTFGMYLANPTLAWVALSLIIAGEYLAGLLALKGAWDMWFARGSSAMEFDMAKKYAYLGAGVGILVWGGLFHVVGGAFFQMWQTEIGDSSLRGAFWFLGICALGALFIAQVPDE